MIKLYRTKDGVTEYWEAREDSRSSRSIRWGKLGEKGRSRTISAKSSTSVSKLVGRESMPYFQAGFRPVAPERIAQVVIQYRVDGMGSRKEIDKAEAAEDQMNEGLGWTGLGHCDGHDIGDGTLNVFCDVVDGPASEQIIVDCLKESGQLDAAVIARRKRVADESYVVFSPEDFNGEFELM